MSVAELAELIGTASNVLRLGKADDRSTQKARAAASMGNTQPGTAAYFREHIFGEMNSAVRRLDDIFRAAMTEIPVVIDNDALGGSEGISLTEMLVDDETSQPIRSFLNRFQQELRAFVSDAAGRTMHFIAETTAVRDQELENVSYLLLETIMGINQILTRRTLSLKTKMDQQCTLIGLTSVVTGRLARSIGAVSLRQLLRQMPGLTGPIASMASKRIAKMYALPANAAATMREVERAQQRLKTAALDGLAHVRLGEVMDIVKESHWQLPGTRDTLPGGNYTLHFYKPGSRFIYFSENSGEGRFETVVMNGNDETENTDESGKRCDEITEKARPQFAALGGGTLCVSEICDFAGMSNGLLPTGTEDCLNHILAGMQAEMRRIFDSQPLLEKNICQLQAPAFFSHGDSRVSIACEKTDNLLLSGLLRNELQWPEEDEPGKPDPSASLEAHLFSTGKVHLPAGKAATGETVAAPAELPDVSGILDDAGIEQMQFSALDRLLVQMGMEKDTAKGSHTKYTNPVSKKFTILAHRYTKSHNTVIRKGIILNCLQGLLLNQEQLLLLVQKLEKF